MRRIIRAHGGVPINLVEQDRGLLANLISTLDISVGGDVVSLDFPFDEVREAVVPEVILFMRKKRLEEPCIRALLKIGVVTLDAIREISDDVVKAQ